MTVLIHTTTRPRAWRPEDGPRAPGLPRTWLAALPPAKRTGLRSLRCASDRWDSLVGLHLLARGMAAAGALDFDPAQLRFGRAVKPRWERSGAAPLDFSISHAGGLIACAVSSRPGRALGIDVEPLRALPAESLGHYLTADERERAATPREVLGLWTRKESVVKAAGGQGLARIPFVELEAPHTCGTEGARLDGTLWRTTALDLASGFAACLATPGDEPRPPLIEIRHIAWEDILNAAREAEPVP